MFSTVAIYCGKCEKASEKNLLLELAFISDNIFTDKRDVNLPVSLDELIKYDDFYIGSSVSGSSYDSSATIVGRLIKFIHDHRKCSALHPQALLKVDICKNYYDIYGNKVDVKSPKYKKLLD